VGTNQAGDYSVEIYNGYGSLISSNGVLTVKVYPPIIEIQPSSQRVMAGSSASFTVSVSGTAPFRYQWRFNGSDLFNATNSVYAIQAVATTNTGDYSVVVNNLASSVTSSNALLTVIVPPTIALQLLPGYPLLNLYGMLTSNFVVQYSTNLAGTNWVNLLSLTNLPSSPYLFLDPAGVVPPARYYRAIMQ
jgi:Immunoglobulin domain